MLAHFTNSAGVRSSMTLILLRCIMLGIKHPEKRNVAIPSHFAVLKGLGMLVFVIRFLGYNLVPKMKVPVVKRGLHAADSRSRIWLDRSNLERLTAVEVIPLTTPDSSHAQEAIPGFSRITRKAKS